MHALTEFITLYPEAAKEWYSKSNYLAFLSVKNEDELCRLIYKAQGMGIKIGLFREPDMDNQTTAIVLESSPESRRLCCRLPLALSV
jgi:hypothetical protein